MPFRAIFVFRQKAKTDPKSQKYKLEKEKVVAEAEYALLKAQPSFLNVQHLIELLVNSLKPKLEKMLSVYDFNSSILMELKELPTKVDAINRSLDEWKRLKVLDAIPSMLGKVDASMDRFANAINSSSQKASDQGVPSAGQAGAHLAEGEKNTIQSTITQPFQRSQEKDGEQIRDKGKKVMSHEEAVEEESDSDLDAKSRPSGTLEESSKSKPLQNSPTSLKKNVVEMVHKDKVKYDKYYLMMLNRRVQGKITNYDVLTRGKGHINLKVYKDDGLSEIIYNFMISDLHFGEWKDVTNACPKRTRARWSTIYTHMRQKLDAPHKTKQELELVLSIPLEEQDLIIKQNLLTKKKKKNDHDLHDYFKSTKRYKKSVQYGDSQTRAVLNESTLGMILFYSKQRQDFISIEYFKELKMI
nr:hypothetical protein [Tanacetum cinerariifolium]